MWLKKIKKFLKLSSPPYLAILLAVNAVLAALVVYDLVLEKTSSNQTLESKEVQELRAQIFPAEGYHTSLVWGDIGKKLVEAGAIDEEQYRDLFRSPAEGKEEMDILAGNSSKPIGINENNSRFVLNTLWAFGLIQKSKVLDEGPMKSDDYAVMDFASTAGWTLSTKPVEEIYSSQNLVELNGFQQDLVKKIAENVYRPCCGNHTAFPDCNHGMAALALIEIEVSAGIPEEQIYRDVLVFNSFWFPQTYLEIAAYFKDQGVKWEAVDAKTVLGFDYSSAEGAQMISTAVRNILPQTDSGGGSCGI